MAAGPPDLDAEVLWTVGRRESQQVGGRALPGAGSPQLSLPAPLCCVPVPRAWRCVRLSQRASSVRPAPCV